MPLQMFTRMAFQQYLIITTTTFHLSCFTFTLQKQICHTSHRRTKTETLCQPQPVRILQCRMGKRIIRTPKAVNLLITISNKDHPTLLPQNQSSGHRIRILRLIKQDGVPSVRQVCTGQLEEFQISIVRHRERPPGVAHFVPEQLHRPKRICWRNTPHLILIRQVMQARYRIGRTDKVIQPRPCHPCQSPVSCIQLSRHISNT
ncbi:hypothetical protein BvCmsNSNP006_05121 [Escherichia coli]|nr:hypothetical protein BvCmsNSNP006_05121 [Escherichia coli]